MRIRYRVEFQQNMIMGPAERPWWQPKAIFGPPPMVWRGWGGAAGYTFVQAEDDPYGFPDLPTGYTNKPGASDCTMLVPGTEDA